MTKQFVEGSKFELVATDWLDGFYDWQVRHKWLNRVNKTFFVFALPAALLALLLGDSTLGLAISIAWAIQPALFVLLIIVIPLIEVILRFIKKTIIWAIR